jgi:DnaJ-class molecular chaperone
MDKIFSLTYYLRMDETGYNPGVGRKRIKEPSGGGVKPYTAKLFESQIAYLQAMGRGEASAFLRELLARAIRHRNAARRANGEKCPKCYGHGYSKGGPQGPWQQVDCSACGGSGFVQPKCAECRGFGYTKGTERAPWEKVRCASCGGSGKA